MASQTGTMRSRPRPCGRHSGDWPRCSVHRRPKRAKRRKRPVLRLTGLPRRHRGNSPMNITLEKVRSLRPKLVLTACLAGLFAVGAAAQAPQATPPSQPQTPPTQPRTDQPAQPPATVPRTGQPANPPTGQPSTQTVPPGVTPAGQIANPNTVIQQTPGQNVGASGGAAPAV